MSWCPFCVWRDRLGDEGRAGLSGLPSRLIPPRRDLLIAQDLIELDRRTPKGTIWKASPRGRAVLRAANELSDAEDDRLDQADER